MENWSLITDQKLTGLRVKILMNESISFHMRKIFLQTCAFVLALLFMFPALAQEAKLDEKIPVNPDIRIGKLKNRLTYYIKRNEKPENKVELRLAVNAGSVLENEDQQGLAHFLEHMAFNGTENFEKNELVSYLQSVGVKFGMHLNAYTSFDETVYILPVPSDSAEILDKGLQILEDWAHNISLQDEDIENERGVVLEEWRLGRGPDQRMMEVYLPLVFKDSRYAERLPIGEKDVIENFEYKTIRNFYEAWYRPDLMAVVAVGDIDPAVMEQKIKEQFSDIKLPKNPKERPVYRVPDHEETLVAIATDPEAAFTQVRLYYKTDKAGEETLGDYRQMLVRQLYASMINQRLDELRQKADPPFIYGYSYYGSLSVRTKDAYQSIASAPEGGVEQALRALVEENERVKRFGFTPGELERAKSELLSIMERAYNERDKTESSAYANEYVRNFLTGEPIPGIQFEYQFAQQQVPGIELEEVNSLAGKWITQDNRVVVITAPDKEKEDLPTAEEVKQILNQVEKADLEPYEDDLEATALMEEAPSPGSVKTTKSYESIGVTELTLSNRVRVVLKPTNFKNDEILMSAYSWGGMSLYPDEVFMQARSADNIVESSGLKDFSSTDLQKLLAGKNVSASPYVSDLTEGFSGRSTPKDLETMLQLVHLYFTEPRKDMESFQSFIAKNKALYQNLLSNPRYYYSDTLARVLTQDHPRAGGYPTVEDWEKVDFDKVYSVYNDRFANAGDFTFFFVGNFEIDSIRPALETYLGSLPATGEVEKWQDRGVRPPDGPLKERVFKGSDPQSIVTIYFEKKSPYDLMQAYRLSSLSDILNIRLIEELREEQGGVYSAGSNAGANKYPYEHYVFRISFPCAPENAEKLTATALDLVREIQENGPADADLQKVKETQRRERQENLKKNSYWLNALQSYYYYDMDPEKILEYEQRVESLSKEDIRAVANSMIEIDKPVIVTLYPAGYQDKL